MVESKQTPADSHEPEKDPGFRNIAKWIFLVAVLIGAWYLLDWLISRR